MTCAGSTPHADWLLRLRWRAPLWLGERNAAECVPGRLGRRKLTKRVRRLDGLGWGSRGGRGGKEGENVLLDVFGRGLGWRRFRDKGCVEVEGEEVVCCLLLWLWLGLGLELGLGGLGGWGGDLDAPSDGCGKELSGLGVGVHGILAECARRVD